MSPTYHPLSPQLLISGKTLNERLQQLHTRMLQHIPCVDRIACAVYDASEDLLRTFVNSTRAGEPLIAYRFHLADSPSLRELAMNGLNRVIDDIPSTLRPDNAHSRWVLEQGYQSSCTVPMAHDGQFVGFTFFDSMQSRAFTPVVQRDLSLYSSLINMIVSSELTALKHIVAAVQVARDFAQLRDFETGMHIERMARYSRVIAQTLAPTYQLSDEFVEHVNLFAPLHDIGKIGIPDKILLKPGKLDAEEYRIIQTHVVKGGQIIERILGDFGLSELPDSAVLANIVLKHHELLDGSGYPAGLRAPDIPLEARIVTVADIFDALTSHRPYKQPWLIETAFEELDRMVQAGKLDGNCVNALRTQIEEVRAIYLRYQDQD
jgi:HD-GYP domain-containing protein (c-di-GMP phosphodiesterase class II)